MTEDDTEREMLESALREHVRAMDEADFRTFVAETRPPNSAEQLKAVAGKVLSGDQLDAWVEGLDPAKFTNDHGEIDEEKVMGRLTAMFGTTGQRRQQSSWGQHSGGPQPGDRVGSGGRREAAKRFGGEHEPDAAGKPAGSGAGGRAEAERRFGKKGKK